jgi:hypothetical protein
MFESLSLGIKKGNHEWFPRLLSRQFDIIYINSNIHIKEYYDNTIMPISIQRKSFIIQWV